MAKKRTNRRSLAMKIEGVEGTPEVLAGTNCLLVSSPKFEPVQNAFDQKNVSDSLSSFDAVPGARYGKLSWKMLTRCSGALGTPPAMGVVLKSLGFSETATPATDVVYSLLSAGFKTATVGLYADGLKKAICAARGTGKVSAKFGEPAEWDVTETGQEIDVTDASMLVPSGLETDPPPTLLSAAFALHGVTLPIHSIEIDLGNKVEPAPNGNQANGYDGPDITERTVKAKIQIDATSVSTFDVYGKLKRLDVGALTVTIGNTAGNIVTFDAPRAQVMNVGESSANGFDTFDIDLELRRSDINAGNDELVITFK